MTKVLGQSGVQVIPIGLESPEQLGVVERHGGSWKSIARRVISSKRISGSEQMKQMMVEVTAVKNENQGY